MKTPFFERTCAKLTHVSLKDTKDLVRTNLGISSRLRCMVPFAKTPYVFGRPANIISERATLALVGELSRDCSYFIDAGANDGIYSFLVNQAASERGLQIHWFEPDYHLHNRLADNLRANHIKSQGNRSAISDQKGSATFHKNLSDDSSGSLDNSFTKIHDTRVKQSKRSPSVATYGIVIFKTPL